MGHDSHEATADGPRQPNWIVAGKQALEYQAEIHTNDADFARFSGLRWRDPLNSI